MTPTSPPAQPTTPSLWKPLYALIWLAFAQVLLGVLTFPASLYLHVGVGFAVIGVAHFNSARIKRMAVPHRLRRIVRITANLASVQFFLGTYAFLHYGLGWSIVGVDLLVLLHLVVGLAILSQASSTATAYDMWEEREFERVEVPTAKARLP